MGRGPLSVKTYLLDDMALVRLQGVLTAAEQKLAPPAKATVQIRRRRRLLVAAAVVGAGVGWPAAILGPLVLAAVWGPAHTGDTQYLRVYVGQLRQKVEEEPSDPRIVLTEPGIGYRIAEG